MELTSKDNTRLAAFAIPNLTLCYFRMPTLLSFSVHVIKDTFLLISMTIFPVDVVP